MLNDLAGAIRFVSRRSGFSAVAALTLALGIAANVTVFALVRAVLLTDEPYRAPHQLFNIVHAEHMAESPFVPSDLRELKEISGIAQVAGCYAPSLPTLRTYPTLLASVTPVSQDFFPLFDVKPHLGRALQASDFDPGIRNAVISFSLWESRFGRSPDVIGQSLQLEREPFTVVGVMPPSFAPPCFDEDARRKAWIPFSPTGRSPISRGGLAIFARVGPNEPLTVVQARLDGYGMRRATETGVTSYAGMFLTRFGSERARNARPGLLLLQSLAACLLLIACANVGSLFLLDASRRDTEFLTRAFVGASPGRIVRQLLLESTVIATIGGATGVGLSLLVGSAVGTLIEPILPRGVTYQVGVRDAIAGVGAGLTACLLFAVFSAVVAARRSGEAAGRTQTHGTPDRAIRRFQNALVAIQVALSVMLAIATAIVGLSYIRVATTDFGLDARGVVTSVLYLAPGASPSDRATAQRAVNDELHRVDDGLSIAFSDTPPFAGGSNARVALDDGNAVAPRTLSSNIRGVTSNYFEVLRIPINRGRPLAPTPESEIGEAVASASFAKQSRMGDSVLGRVVRLSATGEAYRIVGIAADVSTTWIWTPGSPTLYIDISQTSNPTVSVVIRTDSVPATTSLLDRALAQVVPDAPAVAAESLTAIVWRSEAERTFYVASAATFALVAVIVAGVGTYTTVRRMVDLRTKEFAIRMALGMAPGRLQIEVLSKGLVPVIVGIAAGLLGALWLARFAWSLKDASLLINVVARTSPSVTPTAVAVALGAFLLAVIACWLPARQATLVDPALLMKGE